MNMKFQQIIFSINRRGPSDFQHLWYQFSNESLEMVWYESFLVENHITGLTGTFPAHFVAVLADSKNLAGIRPKMTVLGKRSFFPENEPENGSNAWI